MKKNTVRFTIDLDKEVHTNLKILCASHNTSMRTIVQESMKVIIKEMMNKEPSHEK